jgi:hypothetical protein
MTEKPASDFNVHDMWVNVTEAAERIGYHRKTVLKLAVANWKLPEEEREIRLERRSNGYMIWLPSLIEYVNSPAASRGSRGPRPKRIEPNT